METMNKRIFITTRYPVSAQHGRRPVSFCNNWSRLWMLYPMMFLPKMSFMISMPS